MRARAATALEVLALALACMTVAWGPLVQGSALGWHMSGLILLGSLTGAATLLALGVRGQGSAHLSWMLVTLAFLAWVWASTGWAPYRWDAFRWAGVWTAVLGTALSFHLLARSVARQAVVLTWLALTITATLALGYGQTEGFFVPGFEYVQGAGTRFVTGPYFNPSHFSGFLIAGAALLTGLILFTRPHLHTLALLGLLAGLHWLNLKTDASSIPAVFLATGLSFLVWIWRKQRVVGALLGTATLAGLVSVGILFMTPQGQSSFTQYQKSIGLNNSWTAFLEGRRAVWRYGLTMAQDRPLKGVGIGNFITETPRYRLPSRTTNSPVDRKLVNYAHNDGLQVAAELGWPALGLFTLLMLLPLVGRHWTRATYIWAAAMPALAFAGLYDGHLTAIPGTMVFAFALCGLAAARLPVNPGQPSENTPSQLGLEL